jgi:hypothetical protein
LNFRGNSSIIKEIKITGAKQMRITNKDLKNSVENLSVKVETITGENPKYKLVAGDARCGKVYAIGYGENGATLSSFMSTKELDAYIWGMYKAFDILKA